MVKRLGFRTIVTMLLVVASFALESRAQMLSCMPGQPCAAIPPDVILNQEDYMRSVLQQWTPSQINAWQSIDSLHRAWVARLMWHREQIKDIERRTGGRLGYDPYFRLDMPANCVLPSFVEPVRNPSDPAFRTNLRQDFKQEVRVGNEVMLGPGDYWVFWEQVEPNFRNDAEDEMYDQYYQLFWARAKLAWWQANDATIMNCIEAARTPPLTQPQSAVFRAALDTENRRTDSYYDRVKSWVRDFWTAPARVREDKMEELKVDDEIDKYAHDMDRSERPEASPSPSPHNSRLDP